VSEASELAKSNQEQAIAAWIGHLNQLRLDTLLRRLAEQDTNIVDALASIDSAIKKIDLEVVATNRGGVKGMHGFIAEVAEVGVGNARRQVVGDGAVYQWVNDNGPVDLLRQGIAIQQKFVAAGGRLGLGAITDHLTKYPDFIKNGGRYQIPGDHFDVIRKLYAMSPEDAGTHLSRSGDGPSLTDWRRVQAFFETGTVDIGSLEPSRLDYHEVQRGAYGETLRAEKDALAATDATRRDEMSQDSRPGFQEGMQATLLSAAVEGGAAFVMAVVEKRRGGKKLQEFTSDDWADVAGTAGRGVAKGGVRGITIYSLTNFTATSAAVASSVVTSAVGIAEQANKLRRGEITETEFIENAELICLDTAVSALSSLIGQMLIPVPVLGAVIGNTVGTVMYQATRSSLSRRETALIERYLAAQKDLDDDLNTDYEELIERLNLSMTDYFAVLQRAFAPDVVVAALGSVELALKIGVDEADVLDSEAKAFSFFLD
jgi:hypothetical protein